MGSTIDGAPPGSRPYPIEWRDLAATTPADAIRELLLPAPWLFGSLILAAQELYPLALTASFVFFLTGLRVVHGAFHYSLGLPRRATDFVMFTFSMFFNLEHHLFPQVPTARLHILARRLDAAEPEARLLVW